MRVTPTAEQLDYLASLGVGVATAPPAPRPVSANVSAKVVPACTGQDERLRVQALLGLVGGLWSGAIGLFLGGFFGLITHGLPWGICIAACTALGWSLIGFLWTFGSQGEAGVKGRARFCGARPGIVVGGMLATAGFLLCFVGMLVAVVIGGSESARAWVRGTLLVLWLVGVLPGGVLAVLRWIHAQQK